MMKRNVHKWEECRPMEIMAELESNPIAYFVAGIVEEHGSHLATGTDYLPPYSMALEAVEKTGGMVHPILPLAPAGAPPLCRETLRDKQGWFKPSIFVSVELCRLAYTEVLESIADVGFKICVAQGGHMPGITLLREICEKNDYCINGMKIIPYDWLGAANSLGYTEKYGLNHGGLIETSVIMHTCPDYYCDLNRVDDLRTQKNPPSQLAYFVEKEKKEKRNYLKEIREESSAKIGKKVCDLAIAQMIEKVNTLRKELKC